MLYIITHNSFVQNVIFFVDFTKMVCVFLHKKTSVHKIHTEVNIIPIIFNSTLIHSHTKTFLPVHHQLPEFTQTGKFGLGIWNEAGQRLIEFCQENALVIANTFFQQHKRRLYTWTSPDGEVDYILCNQRWRRSIQSAKTRLGADCGSDHELLIAKSDSNWRK